MDTRARNIIHTPIIAYRRHENNVIAFCIRYHLCLDENRIAYRIDIGRRGRRENAEILPVRPQRHDRQQVRVRQWTTADKCQSDNSPVSIEKHMRRCFTYYFHTLRPTVAYIF